jgi:hypothetical protein
VRLERLSSGFLSKRNKVEEDFEPNWEVRGVRLGKANRKTAGEALATVVMRLQQEFSYQLSRAKLARVASLVFERNPSLNLAARSYYRLICNVSDRRDRGKECRCSEQANEGR